MPYIRFEEINKYYGNNHVLKNINLSVEKGQLVTLLGPSGCGKSTLLRCLAGLETVSSGHVFLDGKDVTEVGPRDRGIGMVFQQYSLFPNLTVAQNVAFGLKTKKIPKAEIDVKVKEILGLVGLSDKIDQYPNRLSGGQQQRVALARAIVTEPKVLLLDEPLSAIDALLRRNLRVEIRRIQKELQITTIFVTHDQDEAMVMSDVIHLMSAGYIEQSGSPIDLYSKPRTLFAATFIGNYSIIPAADFSKACGEKVDCETVAIRPEIVSIGSEPEVGEDKYHLRGTISHSFSHGSIYRYSIHSSGIDINADMIYKGGLPLPDKKEVYLAIPKDQVIEL
ncbi:MAG: ABC transporter ATP-binding protein [Chloroflexi bacterium 44-23]|nr:MAG: ABC transporter ATP-binding protein [Chloroflexi bacterium 44-23]